MSEYPVTRALEEAFKKTVKFFFSPFNIVKWLKLSIAGILAGITFNGIGGLNFNQSIVYSNHTQEAHKNIEDIDKLFNNIKAFLEEPSHLKLVILIAASAFAVLTSTMLFFSYIGARFYFIFIESLIQDKVEIRKSWHRNKKEAISLFWVNCLLLFLTLAIISGIFSLPFWNLYHLYYIGGKSALLYHKNILIIQFIIAFLITIFYLIGLAIFNSLLYDFLVPISYFYKQGIIKSLGNLKEIFLKNLLQFILYYLIKIGIAMGCIFVFIIASLMLILVTLPVLIVGGVVVVGIFAGMLTLIKTHILVSIIVGIIGFIIALVWLLCLVIIYYTPFLPIFSWFKYFSLCFISNLPGGINFWDTKTRVEIQT